MKHYDFTKTFRALYDKAVALYAEGQRGAGAFFTAEEAAFLTSNGLAAQHLYDYAEDQNNYGEPGYDIALGIELIRRDYFWNVQLGTLSSQTLDETTLPPKDASTRGIEWLPRIIPKVRAKLRGELPDSLMYCCGGDRKFLKAHDIHPTEFMTVVWRHENSDESIIDWVALRSGPTKVT